MDIKVRLTTPEDFPEIIKLCALVYPGAPTWNAAQLTSHLAIFPEGQFVAQNRSGNIVGYAASLIVLWSDYHFNDSWKDFTDGGYFTNHNPLQGRTLYGAEIMVHPDLQGKGVGSELYQARESLTRALGLLRIRAGARLRGFGKYADKMNASEYVLKVVAGEISDPTLTFQLNRGFQVLSVTGGYLHYDVESKGFAAIIEWLNQEVAKPEDYDCQRKSPFCALPPLP